MRHTASKTLSIKVTAQTSARVARLAKKRGSTVSEVVREAIEAYDGTAGVSALDLVRHLVGKGQGPADLSTSKRHLRDYGR